MTTIANSAGLFARLGYNFDDPNETIQVFSDETKAQLNAIPALIESWAGKDLATSNTSGYYRNPVATAVQSISNSANLIVLPNAPIPVKSTFPSPIAQHY